MSIILTATGWLWNGFVAFLMVMLALDWISFMAWTSLGRKTQKLIEEHPMIPEPMQKQLESMRDGSAHRAINIRTLIIGLLFFLTFIL